MKQKPGIYQFYGSKSLSFARSRLSRITQLLHYGFGDLKQQRFSYGGPKWALCGAALCPLFNAIRRVTLEPTAEHASDLHEALNIAVNQAHNGGWWLNKFTDAEIYNEIPDGNIVEVLAATGAIWQAHQHRPKADVERFVRAVKKWPEETLIAPLRWRKAHVDIGAGSVVLNLKASTLPKLITVQIPTTEDVLTGLLNGGSIRVKEGKVELVVEGDAKPLWEEKPLSMTARPGSINKPW